VARVDLRKALRAGLVDLGRLPLFVNVALQEYGAWVSDERKQSGDPRAVFVVVEAPDDAVADRLREVGPPLVVLRDGWWSTAVSPDFDATRNFYVRGFRWAPVVYGGPPQDRAHRTAVASVRGYRPDRRGPWRVFVDGSPRGTAAPPPGYTPEWSVALPTPYPAARKDPSYVELRLLMDPDTDEVGLDPDQEQRGATPGNVAAMGAWARDGLRRAVLHPRGEGRGRE